MKIHLVPDLVPEGERQAILAANPIEQLAPSTVELPGGRGLSPSYRSSCSADIAHPEILLRPLRVQLADLVGLPVSHQEPLQLLTYGPGGRYGLHHDNPSSGPAVARYEATGGPRAFSALISLGDRYTGGELRFPDLDLDLVVPAGWCAWWSNATRSARHQAQPVRSGRKTVLVCFIRENPYRCEHG